MSKFAVLFVVVFSSACGATNEIGYRYDGSGFFCGIQIGAPASALPPPVRRRVIETESGPEERQELDICDPSVPAEISFDNRGHVERIILRSENTCVNQICIGESYGAIFDRRDDVRLRVTAEEGGSAVIVLDRIAYHLDAQSIGILCFQNPMDCRSRWEEAKVDAILIN